MGAGGVNPMAFGRANPMLAGFAVAALHAAAGGGGRAAAAGAAERRRSIRTTRSTTSSRALVYLDILEKDQLMRNYKLRGC